MKIGAVQSDAAQAGAIQHRVTEIGVCQIGAIEIRLGRDQSSRSALIKYRSREHRPSRIGFHQNGLRQIGAR